MSPKYVTLLCAGLVILAAGCRTPQPAAAPVVDAGQTTAPHPVVGEPVKQSQPAVEQASFSTAAESQPPIVFECADPFAGQTELELSQLVNEVLARNQSLQAMIAAWQAAAQRFPQVVSLDDPMFGFMLGPGSWGSSEVDSAYMVEGSQKIPWPGKRSLRGRVASAEASAAQLDAQDTGLQLAEIAKLAFYDYYLASRWIELNEENVRATRDFRETASQKYRANLVTQQDVLQSDVELADLERRRFELARMQQVAIARINTLLHRPAGIPLPPPPRQLATEVAPAPADLLLQMALERRPDLAALGARVRAEQASLQLANKEFLPDFDVIGRYDAFWQEEPLRPMVGANMNVPLYREKRRAAVREAMYRINQRRAEYEQRIDDIRNDLGSAYARLTESQKVTQLYGAAILPAARQNVDSARAGYTAGSVDFLRLVEAQRQLIRLQERGYEATADYHRRLAELERIVGGPLPQLKHVEEIPTPLPLPN